MNIRKQPGHPRVDYQPCASWTRGFNAASWGFFNDFPGTGPITPPLPPESEMLLTLEFLEGTYSIDSYEGTNSIDSYETCKIV